jgi:hypothetical protein
MRCVAKGLGRGIEGTKETAPHSLTIAEARLASNFLDRCQYCAGSWGMRFALCIAATEANPERRIMAILDASRCEFAEQPLL